MTEYTEFMIDRPNVTDEEIIARFGTLTPDETDLRGPALADDYDGRVICTAGHRKGQLGSVGKHRGHISGYYPGVLHMGAHPLRAAEVIYDDGFVLWEPCIILCPESDVVECKHCRGHGFVNRTKW